MKTGIVVPPGHSRRSGMGRSSFRSPSVNMLKRDSLRVFLADRHTCVRELLKLFLAQSGRDYLVVGEAARGRQLLQIVEKANPDLVIFDFAFPDLTFEEIIRGIRRSCPHARLLAFSCFVDERITDESIALGVHGIIGKDSSLEFLSAALEAVCEGGFYFDRQNAPALCKRNISADLTAREKHVLRLIAEGRATKEIADLMASTVKSVSRARERVMTKLDLHDAVKLTHYAIRRGLVPLQ